MSRGYGGVRLVLVLAAALVAATARLEAADAQVVTGKVSTVTLYRGQALVQRTVSVEAGVGAVEVVVTDLPMHVVPDSLFAETGNGVEVRAVRYRTRAVGDEPREEIRKLDEQIEQMEDRIAKTRKMQQLLSKRETYLDKLENFVAPTMTVELSKGVLDAEQVEKLSVFSFGARQKNADESLRLSQEERDLNKELSLLKRRRGELTSGSSRTIREALLFLDKRVPGAATVKLSYLVGNAGWSPAYSFRAAADLRSVGIEYNAIVRQVSGEDWKDVELTLSTASPALRSQGPGLAPFRVALGSRDRQPTGQAVIDKYRDSQRRLEVARKQLQTAPQVTVKRDLNWRMNVFGNEAQILELQADRDALRVLRTEVAPEFEGPSISYKLPGRSSLASRTDQQMARIANLRLASRFYHVATPVLSRYVYREAEMKNIGNVALLEGPVSVYLDGRFVGRGEIPTVAGGQTFRDRHGVVSGAPVDQNDFETDTMV